MERAAEALLGSGDAEDFIFSTPVDDDDEPDSSIPADVARETESATDASAADASAAVAAAAAAAAADDDDDVVAKNLRQRVIIAHEYWIGRKVHRTKVGIRFDPLATIKVCGRPPTSQWSLLESSVVFHPEPPTPKNEWVDVRIHHRHRVCTSSSSFSLI